MRFIGTRTVRSVVGMSAGTNTKDFVVPAGYSYRVTSVVLYNPDAAARACGISIIDGTNHLENLTYAAALAAGAEKDAFMDTPLALVKGGDSHWAKAASTIRAIWAGMTGGNSAIVVYTWEIWKEGDSTKEAPLG